MKHFTSGLSAAAKTTLRSSPSSTHFHEISIPRDPVTTFRTSQNVSVIDLINRFRRPRSQIPEILGYQCDAHALCKARHHRLTVYERNLSAFSPIFSRGNVYYSRSARNLPRWDEWQSKPRDYASREARDLSPSLDPRADYTVTLEDFETKRFLLLESLTMRHLFRETCHGSIRTAFRLEFFFFSRILRADR